MNHSHMFYDGKVLGMTDDGWMAYSSLVFGLFAAYQWRREARIASLIAYAAVCSYAEHILRYELLTWLDRAAAVSLAIVLVRRVGFIPRRCHLAVAALLWATCDSCTAICRGPCTCPSIRAASVEITQWTWDCLLYTSPSPRDQRGSRMPSSA